MASAWFYWFPSELEQQIPNTWYKFEELQSFITSNLNKNITPDPDAANWNHFIHFSWKYIFSIIQQSKDIKTMCYWSIIWLIDLSDWFYIIFVLFSFVR